MTNEDPWENLSDNTKKEKTPQKPNKTSKNKNHEIVEVVSDISYNFFYFSSPTKRESLVNKVFKNKSLKIKSQN